MLTAAVRHKNAGCRRRSGESMRLLTLKKRTATTGSDSEAVSAQSTSREATRNHPDRRPTTAGKARSKLATICHATPIGFAEARKYRRARSVSPRRKHSRSAAASSAATSHPLPVYRVNAANGVAAYQQTLGKPGHLVVAASPAGRHVVMGHRANRFGGPQRLNQVAGAVLLGEGQHAGQVARWLVSDHPEDREHPRVVLVAAQKHSRSAYPAQGRYRPAFLSMRPAGFGEVGSRSSCASRCGPRPVGRIRGFPGRRACVHRGPSRR